MSKFSELIKKISYDNIVYGRDFDIKTVKNNSKDIKEGDIFIAVKGSIFDGHDYIEDAIDKGARAIVHSEDISPRADISYLKVKNPRKTFADMSNILTGYPSKEMDLVAVTGTNGKTTTSRLIAYLIGKIFGPCANIGTDGARVADELIHTSNTTPDISVINEILSKCLDKDIHYLTMEASSHGLDQKRLDGLFFKVAIFNNLSTEHLDYHKTMENYFRAKLSLFDHAEITLANVDDDWGKKAKQAYPKTIGFGLSEGADIRARDIVKDDRSISFKVDGVGFRISTIADYEVYNSLAAIAALKMMGASLGEISAHLENFEGIGSRFEYIKNDRGINVILDFAHTPRAFEAIFKSLPEDARKIAVFGIQGDRDEDFRKLIGKIVSDYGIYAIITTDDPKFSTYEEISRDIVAGFSENYGFYSLIKDRTEAIEAGVNMANPGDYLLFLGKGEEDFIKLSGNEKTPWDERGTIERALGL